MAVNPNYFLVAIIEVLQCLHMINVLERCGFCTEHRVVPGVELVLQDGPLTIFTKCRRSCLALEGESFLDLLILVGLHERILRFTERREHGNLSNFQWTVDLERPVLHHLSGCPVLLFDSARPLDVGYFALPEPLPFYTLSA